MLFKQKHFFMLFLVSITIFDTENALTMNIPVVQNFLAGGTVTALFIRQYCLTHGTGPQIDKSLVRFAMFDERPQAICYQFDQSIYGEQVKNTSAIRTQRDASSVVEAMPCSPNARLAFVAADLADCFNGEFGFSMRLPMGALLHVSGSDEDYFEFKNSDGLLFRIAKEHLFIKDDLGELGEDELRDLIIEQARKLVGKPYQWGGRCAFPDSGFDCSGVVNIVYQSCGQVIPRGVAFQRRDSRKISTIEIKPADLIFLRKSQSSSVIHVMLYLGDDRIIHATPSLGLVEEITFQEKYGQKLSDYCEGDELSGYYFECGSFL